MKAIVSLKKVVVSLVVFSLLLTNVVMVRAEINPDHTITGNNSKETAYNIGNWKHKIIKTCAIDKDHRYAWFSFNMSQDEQIYVTCSRDDKYDGIVVNKVETSSHMSPNQGNVRHMLMCQTESAWHTSKVSSATSGSYHISSSDRIPVKQRWSFKYNAKAGAKSSMNSVKLRVDYSYDITSGWNFR